MPKKTKKEKLLADAHRKIRVSSITESQLVNRENASPDRVVNIKQPPAYSYSFKSATTPYINKSVSNIPYIKTDLIKITIFTVLALLFQGMLYFLLHRVSG
jgi:hypothetical protein